MVIPAPNDSPQFLVNRLVAQVYHFFGHYSQHAPRRLVVFDGFKVIIVIVQQHILAAELLQACHVPSDLFHASFSSDSPVLRNFGICYSEPDSWANRRYRPPFFRSNFRQPWDPRTFQPINADSNGMPTIGVAYGPSQGLIAGAAHPDRRFG